MGQVFSSLGSFSATLTSLVQQPHKENGRSLFLEGGGQPEGTGGKPDNSGSRGGGTFSSFGAAVPGGLSWSIWVSLLPGAPLRTQANLDAAPTSPFGSWVTLGKALHLFGLWFSHLYDWGSNSGGCEGQRDGVSSTRNPEAGAGQCSAKL